MIVELKEAKLKRLMLQLRDEQRNQPSGIGPAETGGQRNARDLAGLELVHGTGRPTGQLHVRGGRERFPGAGLAHPDSTPHPAGDPKRARVECRSSRRGGRRSETTAKR